MSQLNSKQLLYPLSGSFTGSLLGTASFAGTASYAINSQNVDTGSLLTTASFNQYTSSVVTTSSFNNYTSSVVTTSSFNNYTSSVLTTSSFNNYTSSVVTTSSFNNYTSSVLTTSSFNQFTSSIVTTKSFNDFTSSITTTQIATASFSASVTPLQFNITSASVNLFSVSSIGTSIGTGSADRHSVTGSFNVSGSFIANQLRLGQSISTSPATTGSVIDAVVYLKDVNYPPPLKAFRYLSNYCGSGSIAEFTSSFSGLLSSMILEPSSSRTYNITPVSSSAANPWDNRHAAFTSTMGIGASGSVVGGNPTIFNSGYNLAQTNYSILATLDFWPDFDKGNSTKTYNGWYSMYGGVFDLKAGVGSTLDTLMYYSAGGVKVFSAQSSSISNLIGYYSAPLSQSGISNAYAIYQSGSKDISLFEGSIGVGKKPSSSLDVSGSVNILGNQIISGSLSVSGSMILIGNKTITGSINISGSKTIIGTNTTSGSWLVTGSSILTGDTIISGSLNITGSFTLIGNKTISGSINITGSKTIIGTNVTSGSWLVTGSSVQIGNQIITGSINITGSNIIVGNNVTSGSWLVTGSSILTGNTTITGSLNISGSLTIMTGSSIEFQVLNTGVKIGNSNTDTHQVTGSIRVSGSVTASLQGTASWAVSAQNGGVTSIIAGSNISIDQSTGNVTISTAQGLSTGQIIAISTGLANLF